MTITFAIANIVPLLDDTSYIRVCLLWQPTMGKYTAHDEQY